MDLRDENWMVCEILIQAQFLYVWVHYPTADKKSPRQDLKSHAFFAVLELKPDS